ncbi:MAG TPA: tetratricopeptide repeat protein [Polyangiaceae bacterium]|nr:tetratricopeptide repeat protein [Polyangiaceae bacterium]
MSRTRLKSKPVRVAHGVPPLERARALLRSGQAEQALAILEPLASDAANDASLLGVLGTAQLRLGRRQQAKALFEQVVALEPDSVDALFNLGVALQELGNNTEALRYLERAASISPEQGMLQFRLADALWVAGESARAIGHYQAALGQMPRSLELLVDLSRALRARGLGEGAVAMSRRAVEVNPRSVEAQQEHGQALLAAERLGEALEVFRRAQRLDPAHLEIQLGLSHAAFRCGLIEEVVTTLKHAVLRKPDATLHSNLVFSCMFHPELSAEALLDEARSWARAHADPPQTEIRQHGSDPNPKRRLKVGYVSPDFWDHCQALFMAPLLHAHDREQLEVTCYASVQRPDGVTTLLKERADAWHDVSRLDDTALAQKIRDDGVDILVDLTMHMGGSRLRAFARRPAPVQISWLAYPGTTGMSQIDYRITDQYLDPAPDQQPRERSELPRIEDLPHYSERSIVLADTFWCYDPLSEKHEVAPLPALSRDYVTFGCLNNLAKVNAQVLELWARVLSAVPGSHMLLRAPVGEPRRRTVAAFKQLGIEAARIQFAEKLPRRDYLESYSDIDICLDTFPYNGHTTSLDAQWMGVPVITLVGNTVVGRAGLCQATHLGLPELICHDPEQFVARAVQLANDLDALSELRAGMRARMQASPLMDAPRFASQLEQAYRLAWQQWCAATRT